MMQEQDLCDGKHMRCQKWRTGGNVVHGEPIHGSPIGPKHSTAFPQKF